MKATFVSLALLAGSAAAMVQEQLAGQFTLLKANSSLCPGSPSGAVYTDAQNEQYQIYCDTLLTGKLLEAVDALNFDACIGKCDSYNTKHPKAGCDGVSYGKTSSPQCGLYSNLGSAQGAEGVKSATFLPESTGGAKKTFNKVNLPAPENWVAAFALYPYNVLHQYSAQITDYTSATWSSFVLDQCRGFKGCTSSITFAANNNGPSGGRYWFGTIYSGGHTTVANYTRANVYYRVLHSTAFTVPK